MVGPVVTRIVDPSGAAPLTDLIPISPSPPGAIFDDHVATERLAEMLGHDPAERVTAATGREGKDDLRQRTGLTERIACACQRQSNASRNKFSAVHSATPG
jgi:hypothetical protein